MLNKVHLYYIVIFFRRHASWKVKVYYIILAIEYEIELVLVNSAWNLFTCGITPKQQQSVLLWVILLYFKLSSLPVCVFFFLLWSVCSLEGVPVPLVRQKCRVEQNLHSTFMVCVGRPICTCLEQIRPAAAHGRPIPCWLFMIKICFGKPRSLDPEIRGPFLLALTPLPIYNQHFPFPA